MSTDNKIAWRTYEEVASHLLEKISAELGLQHVEGKQKLPGSSGANWEIDAKGVCTDGEGFVIIEIRRATTRRLCQERIGAIANRIQDTGAEGGIVVSPLPFQSGAKKVAANANIVSVLLDPNSTTEEYILRFLQRVMIGLKPDAISASATLIGGTLEEVLPSKTK